jgi:two-component system, cell cycle response regulator PopA
MRISVRSADARRARSLQDALAAVGVEAAALVGPAADRSRLNEDIAILDASPVCRKWAEGEASRLTRRAGRPRAVVAASEGAAPPPGEARAFDGWIQLDAPDGVVERELIDIRRRAAARAELALRLKTARVLGEAVSAPETGAPWRALYIGEPSPFYLAQERALAVAGGRLEAAFSSFMGFDYLHEDSFNAVTLNATNDATTALALCGALRRNTRLHHLATAVIVRRGDNATVSGAVERGASLIIHADETPEPMLGWLFEKMRRMRRHAHAEAGLATVGRSQASSAGMFSEVFFDRHLARLAEAAHLQERPLTLLALRIALAPGARAPSAVSWNRSANEIAGLAGRLVRTNDMPTLLCGDVIAVALPDADLREGRRAAERVAGVVECTAFATGEGVAGPVVLEHSVVELAAGESSAGLKARALTPFSLRGALA